MPTTWAWFRKPGSTNSREYTGETIGQESIALGGNGSGKSRVKGIGGSV